MFKRLLCRNTLRIVVSMTFIVCMWQIDHWVAPFVYDNPHYLPIALGWGTTNTLAYDAALVVLAACYFGLMFSFATKKRVKKTYNKIKRGRR